MPITQIPFQDPVAPAEKPQPEQLGLYDAQGWETAYRDLDDDARVPHLLIQLQDDLARSRRREAAWISIITHLILIILYRKHSKVRKIPTLALSVAARNLTTDKDVTFLELPPDLQKLQHRPNTNIASDKDRMAMTRHPELDIKELRKILATPPPGAPGSSAPQGGAAASNPLPDFRKTNHPLRSRRRIRRSRNCKRQLRQTSAMSSRSTLAPCPRVRRLRRRPARRLPGAVPASRGTAAILAWVRAHTAARWEILRFSAIPWAWISAHTCSAFFTMFARTGTTQFRNPRR